MKVVIATAVVSLFLHTETGQNRRKTAISKKLGKMFLGRGLVDRAGRVNRNIAIFFLGLSIP